MPGVQGKPPSSDQLQALREQALAKLNDLGGEILAEDIDRLKTDDEYVSRFWKHVFDLPGDQTEEAVNCVVKAFKWRKEFGVDKLDEKTINMDIVNKGYFFTHNRDKDGCKLIVLSLSKHIKGTDNFEEQKKVLVYYLERLEREENNKQISWVFDCKGAGLKNMALELINFIIYCMEHCYPDNLHFIYIYEMPWLLNSVFQLVKKTLPAAGVAKLRDVTKSTFGNFVDDDNRLDSWGGSDDWEFSFEPEVRQRQKTAITVHQEQGQDQYEEISGLRQRRPDTMYSTSSLADSGMSSRNSTVSFNDSIRSPGSSFKQSFPSQPQLLQLSQDLVFSPNSFGEMCARISISNISGDMVGFKMKTTTPDRYKVRPSSGHLRPGHNVVIEVAMSKALSQQASTIIAQDKFMITALSIKGPDLSPQTIHKTLKHSKPEAQYKLRSHIQNDQIVQSQSHHVNGSSTGSGGGELAEVKKEAAKVTKKLNEINEKLETMESQMKMGVFGGIAILVSNFLLLILFLFFS